MVVCPVTCFLLLFAFLQPRLIPDPPKNCYDCAAGNAPRAPFRVYGNTYYVGTRGLTALLITGNDGHVLLDAGGSKPSGAASNAWRRCRATSCSRRIRHSHRWTTSSAAVPPKAAVRIHSSIRTAAERTRQRG